MSVAPSRSPAAWFPGAKFKWQAKEWAKLGFRLRDSPFDFVKTAIVWLHTCPVFCSLMIIPISQANGKAKPCMVSEFFEKPHDPASEEIVKNVAGVAYNGVYPILQKIVPSILNSFCIVGIDAVRYPSGLISQMSSRMWFIDVYFPSVMDVGNGHVSRCSRTRS